MSRSGFVRMMLAPIIAALTLSGGASFAQPPNSQPNPYRAIENYFKLPPGRASFGAVPALEIDRDGTSIWVLTRCFENSCVGRDEAPILKYDASGRLERCRSGHRAASRHQVRQEVKS